MVSIASLLGAWHLWEVVENKLASSLVVSLGKAFVVITCLFDFALLCVDCKLICIWLYF